MHAEYCLGNDSALSEELGLCKTEHDLNCGQAPGDEVCDGERSIATWKSTLISVLCCLCAQCPHCPACVCKRLYSDVAKLLLSAEIFELLQTYKILQPGMRFGWHTLTVPPHVFRHGTLAVARWHLHRAG